MSILLRATFRVASFRRIFYGLRDLLTSAQGQAPPREPQPFYPAHAEFVICDCTIELAFCVLKEHLHLSQLWSAKWEVVQVQIWAGLLLAQLFHGLQVQLAAQQGVEPFDVSIDLLVELVPPLLQRGIAPLPLLGRLGRELGLIRPSTRIRVQTPFVDATWITPAPPEALRPRDTVRYAQRKCARGPRPKTKKAG
jgi:hypothetical protein